MSLDSSYVYLDWAATAPLLPCAADYVVGAVQADSFLSLQANANSLHTPGRRAFAELAQARHTVADSFGVRPSDIVFTSGATEANNAALFGIVHALRAASKKPYVVMGALEHPSVARCAKQLAQEGISCFTVPANKRGIITPEALENVLKGQSGVPVASIQVANSEIGVVQDIAALCAIVKAHGGYFHTDATQAFLHIPCPFAQWGVDAASVSAHKIGGPKGVGALYLALGTPFTSYALGGGQESGKRSGTQNVMGVGAFAAACTWGSAHFDENLAQTMRVRDYFLRQLRGLAGVRLTLPYEYFFEQQQERCEQDAHEQDACEQDTCEQQAKREQAACEQEISLQDAIVLQENAVLQRQFAYVPHILNFLVPGWESETLIARLDASGFGVSGGSACSSQSLEPSAVLTALGVSRDNAFSALRVSFGPTLTFAEIDSFIMALARIIA